jgi:transcriptional regulator with XRE-family HTH domain
MDARLVANYLTKLKERTGLTYEAIAEESEMSVSTIKNLFSGKTEDPRLGTIVPIIYIMNGSVDEMLGKSKKEIADISVASIKDMYEFQLEEQRKISETHIENIRNHYEQHRKDYMESQEKQNALTDKLYEEKCKENRLFKILTGVGFGILIALLILEVANPNLGWLRF